MNPKLFERLVDAGLLTRDQALGIQKEGLGSDGGLVAMLIGDGVREDALAGFFVSRGFGPLLDKEALAAPQRRALRAIPRELANRLTALPLKADEQGVVVAMADPSDREAILELQKTMGERVHPRVALYADMRAAITEAYAPVKVGKVARDSNVVELTRPRQSQGALPLVRPKIETKRHGVVSENVKAAPTQAGANFDRFNTNAPSKHEQTIWLSSRPPPPTAVDIAPQLALLERCETRDEVVQRACAIAAGQDASALFLAVRQGVFRGWTGAGQGVSNDAVRNLLIPSNSVSMLQQVHETTAPYHGPWGLAAADQLLRSALGNRGDAISIAPVILKSRVVGMLCIDGRADIDVARAVADAVGQSLLRLIANQKS